MANIEIKSIQEAITIGNEIERYECAIKQIKDALKAFVEETGLPVDTGEKVWDFSSSESWSFSAENLKALASEILLLGFNPWEYLDLGSRAIAKLNLTQDVLVQYGKAKTTTRFASKKSPAGEKIA
ncbi:MAG TPA: hypothetical protein VFC84_02170 [Desulfosporosinus sp.]|nr:hypothetical protein [Desulfosporosinus sp.]